jgi:hypothetical protein
LFTASATSTELFIVANNNVCDFDVLVETVFFHRFVLPIREKEGCPRLLVVQSILGLAVFILILFVCGIAATLALSLYFVDKVK